MLPTESSGAKINSEIAVEAATFPGQDGSNIGSQQLPENIGEGLLRLISEALVDDHEQGFQYAIRQVKNQLLTVEHAFRHRRLINSVASK